MQSNSIGNGTGLGIYPRYQVGQTQSPGIEKISGTTNEDSIELSAEAQEAFNSLLAPIIMPPRDVPPDPGPDGPVANLSISPPIDPVPDPGPDLLFAPSISPPNDPPPDPGPDSPIATLSIGPPNDPPPDPGPDSPIAG